MTHTFPWVTLYTLRTFFYKSAQKGANACHWGDTREVHNIVPLAVTNLYLFFAWKMYLFAPKENRPLGVNLGNVILDEQKCTSFGALYFREWSQSPPSTLGICQKKLSWHSQDLQSDRGASPCPTNDVPCIGSMSQPRTQRGYKISPKTFLNHTYPEWHVWLQKATVQLDIN